MKLRTPLAIGAAVATIISMAGCSTDGGSASGSQPSDSSLKVMVFGSFTQPPFAQIQIKTAAEAAADEVNATGGVNGRPIQIIPCDDQGSPNGATNCGRQAVDDEVLAVVGAFTMFGDNIVPQLEKAGIPYLLPTAVSQQESTSKISFPVFSSGGPFAAALYDLKQRNLCTTAAQISPESASADGNFTNFFKPVADKIGINLTNVLFPATTSDFLSVASQMTDAGNCGIYGVGSQQAAGILTALNQSNAEYTSVMGSTLVLPEPTLAQLGAAGNGLYAYSDFYFPSTGKKAVVDAVAAMKKKDPKVIIDETALNSYAGVLAFAQLSGKLSGQVTGQAVIDLLNTPGTVIDTGLFPPVDFTKDAGYFPLSPRTAVSTFQRYVAKDGSYVPDGEPFDISGKLGF